MAQYELNMKNIGTVKVSKKRGMKTMRLRVTPNGAVIVSAPWFVPRSTIETFVSTKKDWIHEQVNSKSVVYYDGMPIGRNLTLHIYSESSGARTRVTSSEVLVYLSSAYDSENNDQNAVITKTILRGLQNEAEYYLLPRLHELAVLYNLSFNQAFTKHLTGRWGSCDQDKNILLSYFLVQIPSELADYVMVHELAHTRHMNHSVAFWNMVQSMMPDYKKRRQMLKRIDPRIYDRSKLS